MLLRKPPPPKGDGAGVEGVLNCLEPWEGLAGAGAGVERGGVYEREPLLPIDLPPPALAQALISKTDNKKNSVNTIRPLKAHRFFNIISSFPPQFIWFAVGYGLGCALVNIFLGHPFFKHRELMTGFSSINQTENITSICCGREASLTYGRDSAILPVQERTSTRNLLPGVCRKVRLFCPGEDDPPYASQ